MPSPSDPSYATYRLGGLLNLRIEEGLCPHFQRKLEHCQVEEGEPDISIQRGRTDPVIEDNPRDKTTMVTDSFLPVVSVWKPNADELLVSDGRYEVVRQGGVYEISPGNVTIHGQPLDPFLEHQLLRPLANEILVPRGAIMVHGGAVQIDGKAVLLLGESGKTSLVLSLMAKGADYLSDEYAFLTPDGRCVPFTPYMWLDDRHFRHFPELLEGCFPDPRVRRRMRKNMEFYRMGYSFKGENVISRQLRELLTHRMYFEGLTCRFDVPYPKARMPSSSPITHVFHLHLNNDDGLIVPASYHQIADIEATSAWIRFGHTSTMAKLAGMPTIDLGMMRGAFADCIKGAECHRARMKMRVVRTREDYEKIATEIMEKVGGGHGA
ncbi:MAG: hypothetical protein LUQ39_06415 [Methanomassiliicoccales archaeon]|nr:hypothetical protein [Methanomassiliicoccales archaeon]